MIKKRASQGFLDPIQKRALLRSVHPEAVYLEALLYFWNALKNRSNEIRNNEIRIRRGSNVLQSSQCAVSG